MKYYDFRFFESKRYRALYLLLPVTNGALFMAIYASMHGYLGMDEISTAVQLSLADDLTHMIGVALLFVVHLIVVPVTMVVLDLFVLSRVYAQNFPKFFLSQWRGNAPDRGTMPIFIPTMLTGVGAVGSIMLAGAFSFWPDLSGYAVFGWVVGVAGLYVAPMYLAALVHCEQAFHAPE